MKKIKNLQPKTYNLPPTPRLRRTGKPQSGFTLIEILIASVIFLITIITATAIFSASIGTRSKIELYWATQQNSRLALEEIVREVNAIDEINFEDHSKGWIEFDLNSLTINRKGDPNETINYQPVIKKNIKYYISDDNRLVKETKKFWSDYSTSYRTLTSYVTSENVEVMNLSFSGSSNQGYFYQDDGELIGKAYPFLRIELTVKNRAGSFRSNIEDILKLRSIVSLRHHKILEGIELVNPANLVNQVITETSADLEFNTALQTTSQLCYGKCPSTSYNCIQNPSLNISHTFEIDFSSPYFSPGDQICWDFYIYNNNIAQKVKSGYFYLLNLPQISNLNYNQNVCGNPDDDDEDRSITITFTTNQNTQAHIEYGKNQNYLTEWASDSITSQSHTIYLDGLDVPDDGNPITYYFKITVVNINSDIVERTETFNTYNDNYCPSPSPLSF